jgi:hypothetical protein
MADVETEGNFLGSSTSLSFSGASCPTTPVLATYVIRLPKSKVFFLTLPCSRRMTMGASFGATYWRIPNIKSGGNRTGEARVRFLQRRGGGHEQKLERRGRLNSTSI